MKTIYLINEHQKEEVLLSHSLVLEDSSIYTLSSFQKKYPYRYSNQTLDFIMEQEQVCLDVAKLYLKQICSYPVEKLSSQKGKHLTSLKEELLRCSLLTYNSLFEKKLLSSKIICYLPRSKDLDLLLNGVEVSYQELSNKKVDPTIYELDNKEMEISFVGEKIHELLQKGVDINSIYVCNLDEDYKDTIQRIFSWQGIPFHGQNHPMVSMTPLGSKFLELLKEYPIYEALEKLKETMKPTDEDIYNQIITCINEFGYLKHAKEFIIDQLSSTPVAQGVMENTLKEISLEELPFQKDAYIFLLQGISSILPKTYKDEDYFSDEEKRILGGATSLDKNLSSKEVTSQTLFSLNHLVVTYPKVKDGKECMLTSLLDELKDSVVKGSSLSFLASDFYNQMYYAQELDEYVKYHTISKEFSFLKNHYQIPYATYDHSFTGISYRPDKIYLSYTSLDQYQKCPFSYYISHVLKLKTSQETFSIFIGNLFHKILETYFQGNKDWEVLYEKECQNYPSTYKEKFFLAKLKQTLALVIQIIEEQMTHSKLDQLKTEEKLVIEVNSEISITFQGKIDKILYHQEKDKTICVLIDYKTGNAQMKKEYMPLGFHLQLPLYLYLISQKPHVVVGGIYLQNILPPRFSDDSKSTLDSQMKKALRLQGFSHFSFDVLEMVDENFKNSSSIASLKVNLDGSFSKNAKVLYEEDYSVLLNLAKEKIVETGQSISKGEFAIQPKKIDYTVNISCEYCPYQDLCYHEYKDYLFLSSDKTFLRKEEEHGLDD